MKILIIDIETTGFLQSGGKIIEIGVAELNTKTGEINLVLSKKCFWYNLSQEEIESSWIGKNSDIALNFFDTAESIFIVLDELQEIINKNKGGCTAFNSKFDFDFLESYGAVFKKKLPCLMLASVNVVKARHKNGRKGYKWPTVEEAYRHFFPESNYVEAHRGGDDAVHEAKIANELIKLGVYNID